MTAGRHGAWHSSVRDGHFDIPFLGEVEGAREHDELDRFVYVLELLEVVSGYI